MSQRTIVEFNHDFAHRIRENPDAFMSLLSEMFSSGVNGNPENKRGVKLEKALARFGVRTTPTCHHSEDRRIILGRHTDVQM